MLQRLFNTLERKNNSKKTLSRNILNTFYFETFWVLLKTHWIHSQSILKSILKSNLLDLQKLGIWITSILESLSETVFVK